MAKPQYGAAHQARRKAWAAELARLGSIQCGCNGQCRRHRGRCATILRSSDRWHLGHRVADTHGGDGADSCPWCTRCNLVDAANITNDRRTTPTSSDWW